jgi:hypothetical protein
MFYKRLMAADYLIAKYLNKHVAHSRSAIPGQLMRFFSIPVMEIVGWKDFGHVMISKRLSPLPRM